MRIALISANNSGERLDYNELNSIKEAKNNERQSYINVENDIERVYVYYDPELCEIESEENDLNK